MEEVLHDSQVQDDSIYLLMNIAEMYYAMYIRFIGYIESYFWNAISVISFDDILLFVNQLGLIGFSVTLAAIIIGCGRTKKVDTDIIANSVPRNTKSRDVAKVQENVVVSKTTPSPETTDSPLKKLTENLNKNAKKQSVRKIESKEPKVEKDPKPKAEIVEANNEPKKPAAKWQFARKKSTDNGKQKQARRKKSRDVEKEKEVEENSKVADEQLPTGTNDEPIPTKTEEPENSARNKAHPKEPDSEKQSRKSPQKSITRVKYRMTEEGQKVFHVRALNKPDDNHKRTEQEELDDL